MTVEVPLSEVMFSKLESKAGLNQASFAKPGKPKKLFVLRLKVQDISWRERDIYDPSSLEFFNFQPPSSLRGSNLHDMLMPYGNIHLDYYGLWPLPFAQRSIFNNSVQSMTFPHYKHYKLLNYHCALRRRLTIEHAIKTLVWHVHKTIPSLKASR